MANEESGKSSYSSNPKVPPLKIVFSSHHNNAVVNISSLDETDSTFLNSDKDDNSNDHIGHKELSRRSSLETSEVNEKHYKKCSKPSIERNEPDSGQTSNKSVPFSSSSSSSSSSERSDSTTPSSESESLASTIILDNQQVKSSKNENKDDTTVNKQVSKCSLKVSHERTSSNNSVKKSQDSIIEQSNDSNSATKEQILNANQRITRSSQRAAQQSKTTENQGELNGDESIISENQDKSYESSRKVKRRKGEPQEVEQEGNQATIQPPVTMANIYPSDYQLPPQNSFELYRDIRQRPYNKLMKLNHIQPRVPYGFKDYLLNAGPYLLDGNKLGVGLSGSKLENTKSADQLKSGLNSSNRTPLRMKLSNLQKQAPYHTTNQRHITYTIPKLVEAPKTLQVGSPLFELFQDQEKARQQMRMQHLKERERSILASEQEILRAYNKAAIADVKQKLHLSACTYFYYQERYHYSDEKSGPNGNTGSKEVPHSQDNSFLCIEGGEATKSQDSERPLLSKDSSTGSPKDVEHNLTSKSDNKLDADTTNHSSESALSSEDANSGGELKSKNVQKDVQPDFKQEPSNLSCTSENVSQSNISDSSAPKEGNIEKLTDKMGDTNKNVDVDSDHSISESSKEASNMSEEDLKIFNKEAFLNQLQDIDDKWDKIKKDMLVRHKNEADSLYAVQTLEWEWKAKEIGVCDVRAVMFKIEPELVPRVEVLASDY